MTTPRPGSRTALAGMPVVLRCALIGAATLGALGAATGLGLGLAAYPPTAWFAVLEVGVPATLVGYVFGALVGLVLTALGWVTRRGR